MTSMTTDHIIDYLTSMTTLHDQRDHAIDDMTSTDTMVMLVIA